MGETTESVYLWLTTKKFKTENRTVPTAQDQRNIFICWQGAPWYFSQKRSNHFVLVSSPPLKGSGYRIESAMPHAANAAMPMMKPKLSRKRRIRVYREVDGVFDVYTNQSPSTLVNAADQIPCPIFIPALPSDYSCRYWSGKYITQNRRSAYHRGHCNWPLRWPKATHAGN